MSDAKVQVFDEEDLQVLSRQLQDAIVRAGDIAYLPRQRRFAMAVNRFDWQQASEAPASAKSWQRRSSGVRFEQVKRAQVSGIDQTSKDAALVLLAVEFTPAEVPSGMITLRFAAGVAIRLEVDCIEAELKDLGAVWSTTAKPDHNGPADGDS